MVWTYLKYISTSLSAVSRGGRSISILSDVELDGGKSRDRGIGADATMFPEPGNGECV